MQNLIREIKQENQDFEFYPTTKEIVQVIYNDMARKDRNDEVYSLLDIGCGNGNFFTKFGEIRAEVKAWNISIGMSADEDYYGSDKDHGFLQRQMRPKASISDKFGIEKSQILIQNLPNDVIIIGTDFNENTLLDKKVDVIFCNPPYSEYEDWAVKIINEAYCRQIYLVIPQRWRASPAIEQALKNRNFKGRVLGNFDFLDAERAARAKVEIVKISRELPEEYSRYRDGGLSDPFEQWFEHEFKLGLKADEDESYTQRDKKAKAFTEQIKGEVVKGRDITQVLAELYRAEMTDLLTSYKKIAELDGNLLKELGCSLENIKTGLKTKIAGVKYKYWHELFDNLDKIRTRLTSSKREILLKKLHGQVSVDFTETNAYAIVIWVIKNANQYFDEQLKEMFIRLTEPEYIKNYKSNQRTWQKEGWRYAKENHSHYTLDYRIITRDYRGHNKDKSDLIDDVRTIASNLGFNYIGDVKSFQNGNVHFRMNKQFMKAFNVEASRLFGWIKSSDEILRDFHEDCEITASEAKGFFKSNFLITSQPKQLLLTNN